MIKIILLILSILYTSFNAYSISTPKYSYSEIYIYDSQDEQKDLNDSPTAPLIADPFSIMNKHIFNINFIIDSAFLAPAAEIYLRVVPDRVRMHIGNAISNIGEPVNFVNLFFQGKFSQARISLARFMTNTIMGFFGILDVASELKLNYKGEDFGQTLGYHKIPTGPYLVAPLLGPTSVRDLTGKVADFFIDPLKYGLNSEARNAVNITWLLHKRAGANDIIKNINASLDPYETAKILYIQNRISQVNN
jgi:phospholipid-binding lipoprotein MlaA